MKKIATITFHSSYNYGSNLQAYALQEYIKKICNNNCEYKIINLRTNVQKEMYDLLFHKKNIKNLIKYLLLFKYMKQLKTKKQYFEKFINERLNLTKEYITLEELKQENFNFDYYISGSDQLWNLNAIDFDWAYYLEFVKSKNKISYAASFGSRELELSLNEKDRVKEDLEKYKNISVREKGSYDNVYKLTGIKPKVNIDPTLLLTKVEWEKIIFKEKLIEKEYILLYDLKEYKLAYEVSKILSKKLKIPVIVTNLNYTYNFLYNFEKYYDCGPLEFLNLIKNAKIVVSSSFHGTVFSIIFNKPFFSINGDKDFRIKTLLEKMELKNRSINKENIEERLNKIFDINFKKVEKVLKEERKKSEKYLKDALDIKE